MTETKISHTKNAFTKIAIWQIMAFIFLLTFLWANEMIDFYAQIYGEQPTPFNPGRFSILAAAVITAAIITVGHTYEQQRAIVKNFLTACIYCHRVKTPSGEWEHVEEYFLKTFPVRVDRGACPECQKMLDFIKEKDNKDNPLASVS
jgi:hypothetical protein